VLPMSSLYQKVVAAVDVVAAVTRNLNKEMLR
jgi:hypothetical protein